MSVKGKKNPLLTKMISVVPLSSALSGFADGVIVFWSDFFEVLMSRLWKLKHSKRKRDQDGDLSSFQNNLEDYFFK